MKRPDSLVRSTFAVALFLGAFATAIVPLAPAAAQTAHQHAEHGLLTRAEATDYVETSRYDDVIAFVKHIATASDRAHLTHFGYSF